MPTDQGLRPSRVEPLALQVLLSDIYHQFDSAWVERHAPQFDPAKIGELVVSQRPHGLFAVLDGNRRTALTRRVLGDLAVLDCRVHEGLTFDQEAEIAHSLNAPPVTPSKQHKPTPMDRFLARRAQGDEAAATITKLAASLGWEISERQTSANIVAIASLERIFHGGEEPDGDTNSLALWQTVYAVTRAWGHQRDAVNGDVLLGVGLALLAQRGRMDLDGLIRRMGRFRGGPRTLLDTAREARQREGGCTVAEAVARLLTP